MLQKAEAYVRAHAPQVDPTFRPRFHLATPVGWINDPNGFCVFRGRYHVFAQFHPYDSVWGPMHWGHWVSDDLVVWTWLGVALAPDSPYDDMGCFSGTALEDGERLILIYTGVHRDADGRVVQEQCIAESHDGIHFEKWACNPVIGAKDLPPDGAPEDFRDPKLIRTPDGWRVIAANRGEKNGRQLSFVSPDLVHWTCEGVLLEGVGQMPECPDYGPCDGRDLMLTSVMNLPQDGLRFQNGHHDVVYLVGQERDGRLLPERMEAVDLGPDFYAPQRIRTPDGRSVMIAWMDMWQTDSPTHYLGHGWRGQFTIARELSIRDGRLLQRPVRELERLRGEAFEADVQVDGETAVPGLCGRRCDLLLDIAVRPGAWAEVRLLQDGGEYFSVRYDPQTQVLAADRSRCGYTMGPGGGPEVKPAGRAVLEGATDRISLRILVDQCSVEVFAGDGEVALTTLAFPKGPAEGISFAGQCAVHVRKWAL